MKDLFQEPYHKELHEIMLRKGYSHHRIYDDFIESSFDCYEKDGRVLDFWEDEYMIMVEEDGTESPLHIFIQETDGIFDPDKTN